MAIEPRNILETFFETGDVPTQDQFTDLIDSYIHKLDDGVTIYVIPATDEKRFGINNLTPEAPLGIKASDADDTIAAFNKTGEDNATWFLDLNPAGSGDFGFNIDQKELSGLVSRFFIQESDGYIGLGTTQPDEKLHIENSLGGGITGIKILNSATIANQGFIIGHGESSVAEQNGAFSIFENSVADANNRFTIIKDGNIGINELIPDTKLHITKSLADPKTDIDLIEGTGIVTIGPITNNIVADYRGIQARTGVYVGSVIDLSASELNIQRMGGAVLFHGDSTIALPSQGIITDDARLGLGTITPGEKIEIAGAIKIGTSLASADGTIRYTGTDFEGHKAGAWVSLTGGVVPPPPASLWTQGTGDQIYYLVNTDSRVAIGANTAGATLDINDAESGTTGNTAAIIYNHAQTSSINPNDNRVILQLKSNGTWANTAAKNIGLYISDVSGLTNNESNIAAVMDGNIVIGGISGSQFLGVNANRVLSIQNGTAPDPFPSPGIATSVQLYSQDFGTPTIPTAPTLHVMRADGDVVKLYRETGLTATDTNTISLSTYDDTVANVIKNTRTRLAELEAKLISIGLLNNPV